MFNELITSEASPPNEWLEENNNLCLAGKITRVVHQLETDMLHFWTQIVRTTRQSPDSGPGLVQMWIQDDLADSLSSPSSRFDQNHKNADKAYGSQR